MKVKPYPNMTPKEKIPFARLLLSAGKYSAKSDAETGLQADSLHRKLNETN